MLHAVGQGALAVECRIDDDEVRKLLRPLDDRESRLRCTAERSFMRELEGGCSVPLGVWTELVATEKGQRLSIKGTVCSLDGLQQASQAGQTDVTVEEVTSATDAEVEAASALGRELAGKVAALGGGDILKQARSQMPSAPLLQAPAVQAQASAPQ